MRAGFNIPGKPKAHGSHVMTLVGAKILSYMKSHVHLKYISTNHSRGCSSCLSNYRPACTRFYISEVWAPVL